MNVLVVGGGGREHALCWALAASPLIDKLYCAPGNGGIAREAECAALDIMDFDEVASFCREKAIEFVVVGPEAPLVAGLADHLEAKGIRVFGPSAKAARLEGSKGFMKDLCAKYRIPSARYGRFTEFAQAAAFIENTGAPIVVKADGLAQGKGVVVAETVSEAKEAARALLEGRLGAAGRALVIEEFLEGEEASFMALVDGATALPLESAQDHKRVGEGDTGPNTGGMGAYSPAPVVTREIADRALDKIVRPLVRAMAEEGWPFIGVLYAGLMIGNDGPKLLEVNVRFGDPECQVLVKRLMSDLFPALLAARDGVLDKFHLRWYDEAAVSVVMAAKGYPGAYAKGSEIKGLEAAEEVEGVSVFHAGTKRVDGRILADGGRVLNVTALGLTLEEARERCYRALEKIDWGGGFYRRDIGWRALKR